jgi:hypothetical protein
MTVSPMRWLLPIGVVAILLVKRNKVLGFSYTMCSSGIKRDSNSGEERNVKPLSSISEKDSSLQKSAILVLNMPSQNGRFEHYLRRDAVIHETFKGIISTILFTLLLQHRYKHRHGRRP